MQYTTVLRSVPLCMYMTLAAGYLTLRSNFQMTLKGTVGWDFGPVYWPVWMHLGLNKNRFWVLNFKEALSIWESQVLMRFNSSLLGNCKNLQEGLVTESAVLRDLFKLPQLLSNTLMLLKNILGELRTTVANPSARIGDSVANPF